LLEQDQAVAGSDGHFMWHLSTSRAEADRPRALQLLIRAALGAARTCERFAQSEHAGLMLEAAGYIARQSNPPATVRSLSVLFGYYIHKLAELWPRGDPQEVQGSCLSSMDSENPRKLDHKLSAEHLSTFIHPATLNREYLFWSARLVTLSYKQELTSPLLERELCQLGETFRAFLTSVRSLSDNCQGRSKRCEWTSSATYG
jgi:hypothetical protein